MIFNKVSKEDSLKEVNLFWLNHNRLDVLKSVYCILKYMCKDTWTGS